MILLHDFFPNDTLANTEILLLLPSFTHYFALQACWEKSDSEMCLSDDCRGTNHYMFPFFYEMFKYLVIETRYLFFHKPTFTFAKITMFFCNPCETFAHNQFCYIFCSCSIEFEDVLVVVATLLQAQLRPFVSCYLAPHEVIILGPL